MKRILQLSYLSPISKYDFDNKKYRYLLVLFNVNKNVMNINYVIIKNMRYGKDIAFILNKLLISNREESTIYQIRFYAHNLENNNISAIFSGEMNTNILAIDKISVVSLYKIAKPKSIKFSDVTTFMNEIFINETFINTKCTSDKLLLFVKLFYRPNNMTPENLKLVPIKINVHNNLLFVYDRYKQTFFKEYEPEYFKQITSSHTYKKNILKNLKMRYYLAQHEKIYANKNNISHTLDPYKNNIVTAPIDARYTVFNTKGNKLTFTFIDEIINIQDLGINPNNIGNGSGYIGRVTPLDNKNIYMPYNGYLKEISINTSDKLVKGTDQQMYTTVMRFESKYFVPPKVGDRDLLALINGNFMNPGTGIGPGNSAYPQMLGRYDDYTVVFYLVIITYNKDENSIKFKNEKFMNISDDLIINESFKTKATWFDLNENIGRIMSNIGYVLVLFNREIKFEDDIGYYSNIFDNKNALENYVKSRDTIGYLQ